VRTPRARAPTDVIESGPAAQFIYLRPATYSYRGGDRLFEEGVFEGVIGGGLFNRSNNIPCESCTHSLRYCNIIIVVVVITLL